MGRVTAVVVAVIALVGLTALDLSGQGPTFRGGTDLATFGVTVTDRRGAVVDDLTQEDFELLEDGTPQTVRLFARGDAVEGPELHVGLLFDTSGSMGGDIDLARTAAIRFLNTLKDSRDMTLVDFDTEVRVAKYGQADFPRLVERIRSRKPNGFTAMYDALGVDLDGAQEDDGRTILVLYTDGGDTRSSASFKDIVTLLRASDVTVHSIGFLEHQPQGMRGEQQLRLTQIATETGGQAFFPRSLKQIDEAYDRIVGQIRSQYTLGFVSTNTRTDGAWRKVEVRLRDAARRDLKIQARKGYFAAYREP